MRVDPTAIAKVLDAGRTLAPEAVRFQVFLMSGASIVTVLVFNYIRPKNKIIYEPKVKYHEDSKPPPKISSSFFGWLPPLIHTREPELIQKVGLDAVAFLRFLRLLRTLFSVVAVLACGALIPVNVLYNLDSIPENKRDLLSMMTIRDVKGMRLYAHVAVSYLITFLVVGLVYIHWRDMMRLRRDWFQSPEYIQSFYARTLGIVNVPSNFQSDEGIGKVLGSVKMPYPATSIHISRKVGRLPDLIEYHNETVREFEKVLVKYLKGRSAGKSRPMVHLGGLCGVEKDAIEFYSDKLKRTEAAVDEYRRTMSTRRPESYGFASPAAVPYAHLAARKLIGKHPKGTTIFMAPNPKDIIWENMSKSSGALRRGKMMGWLWLTIVCFLSLMPLFLVAALANLESVTALGILPFLLTWIGKSRFSFSIFSGTVPPAVSALFTFFLPRIMRWLSQYMGALTHARLDRAVVARYFAFLVISQLIIFTLLGVAFNSTLEIIGMITDHMNWRDILNNLDKLPKNIHKTYINQASYWLKYFPMRGFLVFFDLAQVVNLVWISLKTRIFGRTPRDIREWTQPPEFEYAIYYANILFMAAVGLLFAPLAPLVALAAAIVLWMSSWVYKYQLMYVFITKVETGGRLWNLVINRLLFSVLLMQALVVLTIGLQDKFHSLKWLSTIPPFFIILFFKIYLRRKFGNNFRYYIPTEQEIRNAMIHSASKDHSGNRLESRFGHPALHAELFTPMVHADLMPLLRDVYRGKITESKETTAKLREYGGQKVHAQVLDGIKIAAVSRNDLEMDPTLYQRDRGDYYGDRQSVTSSAVLSDGRSSFMNSTIAGDSSTIVSFPSPQIPCSYGSYLSYGPGSPTPGYPPSESPPGSRVSGYFRYPVLPHHDSTSSSVPLMSTPSPRQQSWVPSPQSPFVPPSQDSNVYYTDLPEQGTYYPSQQGQNTPSSVYEQRQSSTVYNPYNLYSPGDSRPRE